MHDRHALLAFAVTALLAVFVFVLNALPLTIAIDDDAAHPVLVAHVHRAPHASDAAAASGLALLILTSWGAVAVIARAVLPAATSATRIARGPPRASVLL